MLSHEEAQELHELVGGPLELARKNGAFDPEYVTVKASELERARELAALLVSDTDPDKETEEYPAAYHWLGWEAEEDFEPGRPDTYFLTICNPDGEEIAVIVHRTVDGQFPLDGELAKIKEREAQHIVDALNAANGL